MRAASIYGNISTLPTVTQRQVVPQPTSARGGGGGSSRTSSSSSSSMASGPSPSNVYKGLAEDYEESRKEQQTRYKQGLTELAQITGLFGPEYGAGMEKAALAGARQSMIGRGLGGTTRPMAVGAGMKAGFEDLRRGKLATALQQMAEYRRTSPQIYPTAGVLANLSLGARSSALQESAMNQPMTIASGDGLAGGPSYMGAAQSWAAPFNSGGVSNAPRIDFTLPW